MWITWSHWYQWFWNVFKIGIFMIFGQHWYYWKTLILNDISPFLRVVLLRRTPDTPAYSKLFEDLGINNFLDVSTGCLILIRYQTRNGETAPDCSTQRNLLGLLWSFDFIWERGPMIFEMAESTFMWQLFWGMLIGLSSINCLANGLEIACEWDWMGIDVLIDTCSCANWFGWSSIPGCLDWVELPMFDVSHGFVRKKTICDGSGFLVVKSQFSTWCVAISMGIPQ